MATHINQYLNINPSFHKLNETKKKEIERDGSVSRWVRHCRATVSSAYQIRCCFTRGNVLPNVFPNPQPNRWIGVVLGVHLSLTRPTKCRDFACPAMRVGRPTLMVQQRCREYTVRTLGSKSTERFEAKNDGTFHCFQSCSLGGDGGVFRRIADWSVVSKQRRSTTRLTGIKKQFKKNSDALFTHIVRFAMYDLISSDT